jgi:flagellar biosynthesis GTPase FlhF
MALNDLLSSSFLFSIAIIIILIGGIFAYVSYRMSEQDHKISSMLGLISTMAGELQFFRSKLSNKQEEVEEAVEEEKEKIILDPNNLIAGSIKHSGLISVSDDEHEDESEEDESEEDESEEDESEEDESEEDETDDETEHDELEELDFVKSEEGDLEDMIELDEPILNFEDITENNIKSIHLEEPIDLNFTNNEHEHEHDHEHVNNILSSDLKSISITDLEEPNKKQEYKKMSINKLREVVVEKGIITEASKLKKQDLLKLLGDE